MHESVHFNCTYFVGVLHGIQLDAEPNQTDSGGAQALTELGGDSPTSSWVGSGHLRDVGLSGGVGIGWKGCKHQQH